MRLPKLDRGDAVRVRWVDSTGGPNVWQTADDVTDDTANCTTVGMVHTRHDDRITLVLSVARDHDSVDGVITIPAVAITAIHRLTEER